MKIMKYHYISCYTLLFIIYINVMEYHYIFLLCNTIYNLHENSEISLHILVMEHYL